MPKVATPAADDGFPAQGPQGTLAGSALGPPTGSTSPLTPRVQLWHTGLIQAHDMYCTAPGQCTGLAPLQVLLAADPGQPDSPGPADRRTGQCAVATEAELLIYGVYHGFRILPHGVAPGAVPHYQVTNYPVTQPERRALATTLQLECEAGMLRLHPQPPPRLTAIYAKSEAQGTKIRTICDYSQPEGQSVNKYADARTFQMMTHQDAYALMRPYGYMGKVDIKSAFRTVGVHPEHWELLGYAWTEPDGTEKYYIDTRCPFGLRCSPEIFCRLSHAVRCMLTAQGYAATVVYVDDFLVLADTEDGCRRAMQALLALLRDLGFTISEHKVLGPAQAMVFCGLELCTNADGRGGMTVTVPAEKLRKAEALAGALAAKSAVTRHELDSAIGYFNHLTAAIRPARVFTRRLIHAHVHAERKRTQAIPVTRGMQLDLQFWQHYAATFNGTAVILTEPIMEQGFLSTDASGEIGMGGFYAGKRFSVRWEALRHARLPRHAAAYHKAKLCPTADDADLAHINYKELYAIWWALLLWHPQWTGRYVILHCDNDVARQWANTGSTAHPKPMRLLRAMYKLCAEHNITLHVVRIASAANKLSDALSRQDWQAYNAALVEWQRGEHEHTEPRWFPRQFQDPGFLLQKAHELRKA